MLFWIDFDPLLKPVDNRGFGVDDKLSGVRLQRAKHPGRLVETKPCGYYSILFWLFKWQILKNGVKSEDFVYGTFHLHELCGRVAHKRVGCHETDCHKPT